jgi:hypothetical protein|tara:strand:+ start:4954 stop:5370 length:417 start_codon:yes stop_codon:yes gene_type:complete
MRNSYKDDSFGSRIAEKAKARQAIQDRIKARPGPGDPEFEKIRAEREAIASARSLRIAERKAAKEEKLAREKAEREAKELAEKTAREARELAEKEEADRIADEAIALLAEQKSSRDARYAARKARKGGKRARKAQALL